MSSIEQNDLPDIITTFREAAQREYLSAPASAQETILKQVSKFPEVDDEEFRSLVASEILGAAILMGFSRQFNAPDVFLTFASEESSRRKSRDGHSEECGKSSLYELAHSDAMDSQGYKRAAVRPCDCGRD